MKSEIVTVITQVIIVALTIVGGWVGIKLILSLEKKALAKSKLDKAVHLFILKVTKITLWILVIMTILPRSAPFVTALGAGGAAIALALKDSLGNVAGGILLLLNKPFVQGDTIEVGDTVGIVDSIDLLTTKLHTFDNKIVTVPNGYLNTSVIVNSTEAEVRRVDFSFGIDYKADIEKAKSILLEVSKQCPEVVDDPEPITGVSSHGDSSINLDLKVWCKPADYLVVKYYVEEAVKIAFDKEHIVIPYPHLDVNVRNINEDNL